MALKLGKTTTPTRSPLLHRQRRQQQQQQQQHVQHDRRQGGPATIPWPWILLSCIFALVGNQLLKVPSTNLGDLSSSSSYWFEPQNTPQPTRQHFSQRKVFSNMLTLPDDFVPRRSTNRGKVQGLKETTIHDLSSATGGCAKSLTFSLTRNNERPSTCTPLDVYDWVQLRIYVDGHPEPLVDSAVNHLFGIHHAHGDAKNQILMRPALDTIMYSVSSNGNLALKLPMPYAHSLKVTLTKLPQYQNDTTVYLWSFLEYEEYPRAGSFVEPLRLHVQEGVLETDLNQLQMAHASYTSARGYLVGFTLGVKLSDHGHDLLQDYFRNRTGRTTKPVDLWYHNGGEMLVLDQRDALRSSLMHGIGAEDSVWESCSPIHSRMLQAPTHGFQYAFGAAPTFASLQSAMEKPAYISLYKAYVDHHLLPFSTSMDLHMGNTEHFEYSSVTYWYSTLGNKHSSSAPSQRLVDRWTVCGPTRFNARDYDNGLEQTRSTLLLRSKLTSPRDSSCRVMAPGGSGDFLDLTYAMILPGRKTNAKLHSSARVSVYATIPYDRIAHLVVDTTSGGGSCIQLEIFHDDATLVWLNGDLVYYGNTRQGHQTFWSDPYQPRPNQDLELAMMVGNTENNNFRAWLVGVTAKSASCTLEAQWRGNNTIPLGEVSTV